MSKKIICDNDVKKINCKYSIYFEMKKFLAQLELELISFLRKNFNFLVFLYISGLLSEVTGQIII